MVWLYKEIISLTGSPAAGIWEWWSCFLLVGGGWVGLQPLRGEPARETFGFFCPRKWFFINDLLIYLRGRLGHTEREWGVVKEGDHHMATTSYAARLKPGVWDSLAVSPGALGGPEHLGHLLLLPLSPPLWGQILLNEQVWATDQLNQMNCERETRHSSGRLLWCHQ